MAKAAALCPNPFSEISRTLNVSSLIYTLSQPFASLLSVSLLSLTICLDCKRRMCLYISMYVLYIKIITVTNNSPRSAMK